MVARRAAYVCLFALTAVLGMGSCTLRSSIQPSVLVIMVEHLGFGSFSCGEDVPSGHVSGFQTFCEESVRFTHAYTPSVMSSAAAVSVLTGKYPYEHGVRHNGSQGLLAKEVTAAEAALAAGFRTSFFSGGPPIWRRSGLNQGFEIFDDNIGAGLGRYYRPAQEIVSGFLDWQESEAPHGRFFSVLFLTDLQFVDAVTVDELGEERERSYGSQIDAIDEAMGRLAKELKRRKVWNNTDIILVGLDGYADGARAGELPAANLFSEATRTTLMIKPRRRIQDGPFNWKIDPNVSLVDIGRTLFEIISDRKLPSNSVPASPESVSLKSTFTSPEIDWDANRKIISESAWAQWRGISSAGPEGIRAAVRQGQYLLIFDETNLLFDTFTDNMESSPLPFGDMRTSKQRLELVEYLRSLGFMPWSPVARNEVEKAILGRELWRSQPNNAEILKRLKALSKKYPDDSDLRAWRAIWALRLDDWSELKAAASGKNPNALWSYVGSANLGEKVAIPDDPCFGFLQSSERPRKISKECQVEGVQALLDWVDESTEESVRVRAMESFIRAYSAKIQARRVGELSAVAGMTWDTPSLELGPSTLDLILSLPEMRRQRLMTRARVSFERTR